MATETHMAEGVLNNVDVALKSSCLASKIELEEQESCKNDCYSLQGILVDDKQTFRYSRRSGVEGKSVQQNIEAFPVIVDFRSILQSQKNFEIIPGVTADQLLHAVVGLYDVSLSDMTPDVLYSSVCDKCARTIILLRDISETVEQVQLKYSQLSSTDVSHLRDENVIKVDDDKFVAGECKPPTFAEVYSDCESDKDADEGGGDDCDEDEDFSRGMQTFLQKVKKRQADFQLKGGAVSAKDVGIENRLVAAATFEKTFLKPSDRIVHLTFIAVRPKYRRCNIGQYMLSKIKDPSVVGKFDAVVVHADNSAVGFFNKNGFSDDIVLNSRWRGYLITAHGQHCHSTVELDIAAMDNEIQRWRQRSIDAYRAEVSCVNRMRHEILLLRQLVSNQQLQITELTSACDQLRHQKYLVEKEFLNYRLSAAKDSLPDNILSQDSDSDTEDLISRLQQIKSKLSNG